MLCCRFDRNTHQQRHFAARASYLHRALYGTCSRSTWRQDHNITASSRRHPTAREHPTDTVTTPTTPRSAHFYTMLTALHLLCTPPEHRCNIVTASSWRLSRNFAPFGGALPVGRHSTTLVAARQCPLLHLFLAPPRRQKCRRHLVGQVHCSAR